MIAIRGGHHALTYLAFPALIWAACASAPGRDGRDRHRRSRDDPWYDAQPWTVRLRLDQREPARDPDLPRGHDGVHAGRRRAGSERELLTARVRASRARLVVAGDEERKRLERDLHDGAQQRLFALAVKLRLAAEQTSSEPGAAASFEGARTEVLEAVEEIASSSTGSTRRRFAGSAWRARWRTWRRARPRPSSYSSCPRAGSSRRPRRRPTTSSSRR